jgi:hypothetical protein
MPGPNVIKRAVMNVDGGIITSIFNLPQDAPAETGWYTLDGRKLNSRPTAKGIYISNGRKMVVK